MNSNLTYHCEGDDLIPDVIPPESPNIGIWGERRRQFLMKHKKPIYTGLLLSGELNAHLEEIDQSVNEMFDLLIKRYAAHESINEELKAQNQMLWIQKMNNIRDSVTEAVLQELIYS